MEALIAFALSEKGMALIGTLILFIARRWASKDVADKLERLGPTAVAASEQLKKTEGLSNTQAKAKAIDSLLSAIPFEQRMLIPLAVGKMVNTAIEGAVKWMPKERRTGLGGAAGARIDNSNLTGT